MRKGAAKALLVLVVLVSLFTAAAGVFAAENNLVRSIVIEGNAIVDTDIIKEAVVKTKINEPVSEQKLLDDLHSIFDLGYFQDAELELEPVLGGVQVVFHVIENPIVTAVNFSGLPQVPLQSYAKHMKTQIGYILNVNDFGDDLFLMREWIAVEHGYLARVASLEGDTEGRLSVEWVPTVLKDVVIEGNEKTKDFVIERELNFEPGDVVNVKQIDDGLRKVLMLGFFDEISRDFSDEEDLDETVLTINLQERKTGSATFGIAYSRDDGLVGFVEAADDNFFGRGQRVNATMQLGKRLHSYELGFHEPYITKGGTSLGVNLYRRTNDVNKDEHKFSLNTNGGDLTLGHPVADMSRARLTLRMEDKKYSHKDDKTEGIDLPDPYKNRIVGFGLNTNTMDHPFNPTEGFKNDAYLEFALPILGATNSYSKMRFDHSRYFEVKDGGYVFALRGLGGRLLSGSFEDDEKFKIGGAETLRGYTYGDESLKLKGDHMLVMNAEFRFPIIEKITGVVFTDWGTTWDQGSLFSLGDLKNSYGLGVRLDTPLGLLRLDYGFGKDDADKRVGQFYFGIGQTF